ncbi:MAG: RNA methyltransferase [Pseudomonadota bacterium]
MNFEPSFKICGHFGTCGGCTVQDLPHADYRNWKHESVEKPLRQQNIVVNLDDIIFCVPASRRRVTMSFSKNRGEVTLGFHGYRSNDILSVTECLVAKTEIVEALPDLRALLKNVAPQKAEGKVTLLTSDSGLDISIRDVKPPTMEARTALIQSAASLNAARISVNGDILAEFRAPQLQMGKARVTPPPGGFVQAVKQAEDALAHEVVTALKKYKCKSAVDLFSGCGAFTFRMAEHCRVHAAEGDAASVRALEQAAKHTQGLKPITAEKRDLFRRPLVPLELKNYDAVVLDPPWQGATAQIAQLSKSNVPLIIYVSCSPGSFARDAAALRDSGYSVQKLTAIDQFLWSEHIELIAIFTKAR